MGGENSLTIHEISAARTGLPSLLPPLLPLNRQRIMKSTVNTRVPVHQCQCFDKIRGVFLLE